MKSFLFHHTEAKDSAIFKTLSARYHFESILNEEIQTRNAHLFHRKFDLFVIRALGKITKSYFSNLLAHSHATPYYAFTVDEIDFGKHVTASVQRHKPSTITNKLLFFIYFHLFILRASFVYGAALRNSRLVGGVSLGDPWYLDGIVIDYFLRSPSVSVYVDIHPFGLVCFSNPLSNLSTAKRMIYSQHIGTRTTDRAAVEDYMKRRLEKPQHHIPYYMAEDKSFEAGIKEGKINFVIYSHAFSDSQMQLGYDGFRNAYDWVIFTIEALLARPDNPNVYLKGHPNFFSSHEGTATQSDRQIWNKLIKRFGMHLEIVDVPVSNYTLLSQFDANETILISHHGNALVEGAWMGFSSVSSGLAEWADQHQFSNSWLSRNQYSKILNSIKPKQLDADSIENVERYIENFYMNEELVEPASGHFEKVVSERFPNIEIRKTRKRGWTSLTNFSEGQLRLLQRDFAAKIITF